MREGGFACHLHNVISKGGYNVLCLVAKRIPYIFFLPTAVTLTNILIWDFHYDIMAIYMFKVKSL
jgi:hypothetical protein